MLKITPEAARLTRSLVRDSDSPQRGGLRIVLNPVTHSLSMGLAPAPEPADAVVARDGALLFLSQPAAERMQNLTLRAEISTTKSVFFLEP
jgi:Fe-S cluster assembly iron-binding protein IscA